MPALWGPDGARACEGQTPLVHALELPRLWRDLSPERVPRREPRRGKAPVRRPKGFELAPEALALVAKVSALEERAKNARERVQRDLDGVRSVSAAVAWGSSLVGRRRSSALAIVGTSGRPFSDLAAQGCLSGPANRVTLMLDATVGRTGRT